MTRIEPFENGIHSLAEALKAFKTFHDDNGNAYALKDAILRSHHALETLFKSLLLSPKVYSFQLDKRIALSYGENWVLLLPEKTEIKDVLAVSESLAKHEVSTPFESERIRTVGFYETLLRLRKLQELKSLEESEFQRLLASVRDLSGYRDRLEHFGLEADPEVVGRMLGNVIPRSCDILATRYADLYSRLEELYADACQVIDLLRNEYDELILESIKYFKGRSFSNKPLSLAIEDHGHVGASPYLPELTLDGMLQAQWDRTTFFDWERTAHLMWSESAGTVVEPYVGKVKIARPVVVKSLPSPRDYKSVKGRLDFRATLHFPKAEGLLNLPEAGQKPAFLRQVSLDITAWLEYEAEALYTGHHYDVVSLYNANGSLNVQLTAISKGYAGSGQAEITGRYSARLDHNLAPFRLHAFVAPDGDLKDNYMLEWRINTSADLQFS